MLCPQTLRVLAQATSRHAGLGVDLKAEATCSLDAVVEAGKSATANAPAAKRHMRRQR
jgi:hypothetical protein